MMTLVVKQLTKERTETQKLLDSIDAALAALGGNGRKRMMSADARRRISEAQKVRWAKWQKMRAKKAA